MIALYSACVVLMSVVAHDPARWDAFVTVGIVASGLLVIIWRRVALSVGQVLALALLFRLVFFPLPPVLSDDAFRYVWDGLVQLEGLNPYLHRPAEIPLAELRASPLYEKLNSAEYYSIYPPLSQLIFALGAWAAPLGGWTFSYYLIKGIIVVFEFGGVYLLARLVEPRAAALYAWNPLVLAEVAGQAHTEAVMVGLLVVAVWCVKRGWGGWASAALAGAGLVKLYPFVLFPLLWRRFGWRAVWPGVLVGIGLSAPYAAPGVVDNLLSSLQLYVQLFEFNAGPYYGVKYLFRVVTGADWSKTLGPAFGVLFGVGLFGLYYLDARKKWSFGAVALAILATYLACSTTVHPWYLLGVLALGVLVRPPFWAAFWLAPWSLGTYLFYVDGPYWSFIIIGWSGAIGLVLFRWRDAMLQWIQRRRAQAKVERIWPFLEKVVRGDDGAEVLDLGAGEGYVGQAIQRKRSAEVVLADVIDMNRTRLPLIRYDGRILPFADDWFDATVLYFVLHHCADPEQVLGEALRVTSGPVIVVESLRRHPLQHRILRVADAVANRIRSGGAMQEQEAHVQFRTAEEWRELARRQNAQILYEEPFGTWLHPQQLLVVQSM